MNIKIALLSSDTLHHRFFINMMKKDNLPLDLVIFEKKQFIPKFEVSPFYEQEEAAFEKKEFNKIIDINKIDCKNFYIEDINDHQTIDLLEKKNINYGVVFGTGLIRKHLIDYFHNNLINIHRGIAEEYRGLDSDLWAIYHEDYKNLGVTIHQVDQELDTGKISYCETLKIDNTMKIFHLRFYTTILAYNLMKKTILDFMNGNAKFFNQEKIGRYYSAMPIQLKKETDLKFQKYVKNI
tara:strand:- start:974 stop:1687 length:714 start_codon:yes stop_codon:yes gene_type:complete